jgi:predicted MFS family arabinose efflux permease
MGGGTVAMATVETPMEALWWYGIVVAVGSAGTSIAPIGVLVSRWFPERLGLANSIAISGMGVGQLVIIFALAAWLQELGWRGAFVALGLANIIFVLPLVIFASRRVPAQAAQAPEVGAQSAAMGPVFRSSYFHWLLVLYAICGFHDFFMATHIVALGLDLGMSEFVAGNLLALMGLTGLVGVLLTGVLTERKGPWLPTTLCFILRIVLFAAVLASRETVVVVVAGLAFGFTFWMTAPLTVVFVRERFGTAVLGTGAGCVTMVHHAAGGLGALVAAHLYDSMGNYHYAFVLALALSVAALGCIYRLRRL